VARMPALPKNTRPRKSGPLPQNTWSDRLARAWIFPLLVFTMTWLLIVTAWLGSNAIYHHGEPWTWYFYFKDARYYLAIAEHGYKATSPFPWQASEIDRRTAFFPLLPFLVRLAAYLTAGDYPVAGLIVAVLAGAASAFGAWGLAARVCGRRIADRSVALYCLFPGAMTFGMLYSDPLGVALAAAALWVLLERRWLLAGIIGALGTTERPTLLVLTVVSGFAAAQAIWLRREWRALLAPVLTPLGMLTFFAWLGHRYHDYYFWFQVERDGWNQHFDWGLKTLRILFWADPGTSKYTIYNTLLIAAFAYAVAGIGMIISARLPFPWLVYSVLTVASCVLAAEQSTKPRFVLLAFPLFIGIGAKASRALYWPLLVSSAAILVFLIGWWPNHYYGPAP